MRKPSLAREKRFLKDRLDEYRSYVQMEIVLTAIANRVGCAREAELVVAKLHALKERTLLQVLITSRAVGETPEIDETLDGMLFEHALTDYSMYDHADWDQITFLFPIEASLLSRLKGKGAEFHAVKCAQEVESAVRACERTYESKISDLKGQIAAWQARFEKLDPLEQLAHLPKVKPPKPSRKPKTGASK